MCLNVNSVLQDSGNCAPHTSDELLQRSPPVTASRAPKYVAVSRLTLAKNPTLLQYIQSSATYHFDRRYSAKESGKPYIPFFVGF